METGPIQIEKLKGSNFQIRKQKLELLLFLHEFEFAIAVRDPHDNASGLYESRPSKDKTVRALVDLTRTNGIPEQITDSTIAEEMWEAILNISQRRYLLD